MRYSLPLHNLSRLLFALALSILTLPGCGGGTSGTGLKPTPTENGEEVIIGRVLAEQGMPAAGVSVTVMETGDSVETSDDGSFALTAPAEGEVTLLFQLDDAEGQIEVVNRQQGEGGIVVTMMGVSSEGELELAVGGE